VIRRIILVLSVASLMVAMVVVTALPAFAQGKAQCGIGAIESEGATETFEPGGLGGATSQFAKSQKASGSNLGQAVAFEPEPPATQCAKGLD
jgi:hypothetical protein